MTLNLTNIINMINDGGHAGRMSNLVYMLALESGINQKESERIAKASRLHDIGKASIPPHILNSSKPLTVKERKVIEKHVHYGLLLLSAGIGDDMDLARTIVATHHEHWDGSGYPKGLVGNEIPLPGRIVAICDVYDALRSKRSYKEAWTHEVAMNYIIERKGKQFDPALIYPFLNIFQPITA